VSIARARMLRRGATASEQRLWGSLRAGQLAGLKFRRQAPIGAYVVDFFCPALRLVVEVDGAGHVDSRHDAVRDAWLRAEGYRILRVWNTDVTGNLDGVLHVILGFARGENPSPNPLPQGERARAPAPTAPSPLGGEGRGEG
jgi:very-short-patch-repair endonuclease